MEFKASSVLVTGAGGNIGKETIKVLADGKRLVTAVYRNKTQEKIENVFPVECDLHVGDGLNSGLRKVDCVIHLAWHGFFLGAPSSKDKNNGLNPLKSENISALGRIIAAMEKEGTKRLVFLSALGSSPDSESFFLREKYRAEHMILNSRIPEKIILRTAVVWTGRKESDPFLMTILRLLKYPGYPLLSKTSRLAPVYVTDIARVLVHCSECVIADGICFLEIKGGESILLNDIYKIVGERFIGKPRFPITGPVGRILLSFLERDQRDLDKLPKIGHFLSISGTMGDAVLKDNPLKSLANGPFISFKEKIGFI